MCAMRGEVGPRGQDAKSDCWMSLEIRESGGVEIDLKSKVMVMYGESIRSQLTEGLKTLGIENAKLEVEDAGAVPFVLDARLETAARRADSNIDSDLLPPLKVTLPPSARDRFRRSRLYLPGNQPKMFLNAGLHGADAYILDLEDAVAPPEKDAARAIVRNALRTVDFGKAERMVRINQGDRGLEDLEWIIPHPVQLVLIPKVESPEEVQAVEAGIAEIAERCGRKEPVWLMPIIESTRGAYKALEIAEACESIVALAVGLEDYTADLGVPRSEDGTESFWMRGQIVNACRAAGIQAIDTVYSDVANEEGLVASVMEAKQLGFDGKGCIHPRQIRPLHQAFAPTPAEVDKACKIVRAFEDAEAKGLGVVSLGSKMIDAPVVKRALHTVEMAKAIGKLAENWREVEA